MRNPKRIQPILKIISEVWEQVPDLRLGQIISNAAILSDKPSNNLDFFYFEDEDLYSGLYQMKDKTKFERNMIEKDHIDVNNCVRCGENHKELEFKMFSDNPIFINEVVITRWGVCPTTLEPILLIWEDIKI